MKKDDVRVIMASAEKQESGIISDIKWVSSKASISKHIIIPNNHQLRPADNDSTLVSTCMNEQREVMHTSGPMNQLDITVFAGFPPGRARMTAWLVRYALKNPAIGRR